MNDNRSFGYIFRETVLVVGLPAVFGLFLLFSAGQVVAAAPPNTLAKTYTYVIKYKDTTIGKHQAFAKVQACTGGKVKVIDSYRTLRNQAHPWFYFWRDGPKSGWGAKSCAASHSMQSEGFLIGPGDLPNYHSIVTCKALPPESFTCTHSIHIEP